MRHPTVDGLLGPAQAEIDCDTCFAELDRYAELRIASGAAADAAIPGMGAHLAGCGACREEYESLVDLLRDDALPPQR